MMVVAAAAAAACYLLPWKYSALGPLSSMNDLSSSNRLIGAPWWQQTSKDSALMVPAAAAATSYHSFIAKLYYILLSFDNF